MEDESSLCDTVEISTAMVSFKYYILEKLAHNIIYNNEESHIICIVTIWDDN